MLTSEIWVVQRFFRRKSAARVEAKQPFQQVDRLIRSHREELLEITPRFLLQPLEYVQALRRCIAQVQLVWSAQNVDYHLELLFGIVTWQKRPATQHLGENTAD